MAIPTGADLTYVERFFFQTRVTGAVPTQPLNYLKRAYWGEQGFTGTFRDQERQWVRKIIIDNGGTPTSTRYLSTLLIEALSALGVTPSVRLQENWLKLYKNYNP